MPETFAESEKRFEDLQSFLLSGLSVVLADTKCNAWYDTWAVFSEKTIIGMSSIGRES
jgi:hypothetical protein